MSVVVPAFALVVACSSSGSGDDAGETGAGTTTGRDGGTTGGEDDGSTGGTTGGEETDGGTGVGEGSQCDMIAQDCRSDTLKCNPWSEDADRLPDEARCCALDPNPALIGERCTIQDYDGSCLDDCEKGSFCLLDDEESLQGYCHRLCDPMGDSCEPNQICQVFFTSFGRVLDVPLCMDHCDPLLQDCDAQNWNCHPDNPTDQGQSGFICLPPPPQTTAPLEQCSLSNDCEGGSVCVPGDRVPGCRSPYCCTLYCSLSEPDNCAELDPSATCVDWMSPDPRWDDVGACGLPM